MEARKQTDEALIAILDKRVALEKINEAEMIDVIREIDRRRLWIKFGATSMYDFMTRAHFDYAPVVAQRKVDAARLMQIFPEVKHLIETSEVNLTQLGMMAGALRQKSVAIKMQKEILEAIRGQTVKNTQVILNEMLEIEVKAHPKIRIQRDGSVRVEMTFSKEQWADVEQVKDVVSHSVPNGDPVEVLSYCTRFTLSKKAPASSLREVKPRHTQGISRAARSFVFWRDKTCRHRHDDGTLCESRYQLQCDHIIGLCDGGSNEVENLQLLCGLHNRYKYERESSQQPHEGFGVDPAPDEDWF